MQAAQPRLQRASGTHAIVVAPTRELCLQISDVLGLVLRRYNHLVRPALAAVLQRPSMHQAALAGCRAALHGGQRCWLSQIEAAVSGLGALDKAGGMLQPV